MTIIIPVHELIDNEQEEMLKRCLQTVEFQTIQPEQIFIVCPDVADLKDKIANSVPDGLVEKIDIIPHKGSSDIQTQLNTAVNFVKTEYFSYIGFDDEYSKIWFKNVEDYIKENDDVDVFLPIAHQTNMDKQYLGTKNESAWAVGFTDTWGFVDNDALLRYEKFAIDAMVMKTQKYKDLGGMKKNFKILFDYEFLLRATRHDSKIMVIPKIGCLHFNNRTGSFMDIMSKEMQSSLDRRFWFDQAKKEYFFLHDREIDEEGEKLQMAS